MKIPFNPKLKGLQKALNKSLYAVGGCVRDFILSGKLSKDVDLTANLSVEELSFAAKEVGFKVVSVNPSTMSVVFTDGEVVYEWTSFRREKYLGNGFHTPVSVERTDSIDEDALRRDFRCNALYYNVADDTIYDCVGGLADIQNKQLNTVRAPRITFEEDGLRLLRLARFCGELGFDIGKQTLDGARAFAKNVLAISHERVFLELKRMLMADTAHSFSLKDGHYRAFKALDEISVLDIILPELTLGRGMSQRKKWHNHDVLEHSLRTILYADQSVRLAALLHDIGKPEQMLKTGSYHGHDMVGAILAKSVLTRFNADKATVYEVCRLVGLHMLDLEGDMSVKKLRRVFVENADIFEKLLLLKQADFKAGRDCDEVSPSIAKWRTVYADMLAENVPWSIKDLKISATELMELGLVGAQIGDFLKEAHKICITRPTENDRDKLVKRAKNFLNKKSTNIL